MVKGNGVCLFGVKDFFVKIVIVSANHILAVIVVNIVIVIVATYQPTDVLLMELSWTAKNSHIMSNNL